MCSHVVKCNLVPSQTSHQSFFFEPLTQFFLYKNLRIKWENKNQNQAPIDGAMNSKKKMEYNLVIARVGNKSKGRGLHKLDCR